MALQPGIILSGQQFDLAGSMGAGNQLAAQTNQLQDQNALRQVYQTQGAGILQGNQQSLNALAAVDPNLAINAQGGVISNQTATRQLEVLNAQEKRAIAEAARNMDEAQKAAAAAAVKQEVLQFIAAPTPEIFDQMVTQAGKPELAGMWENRQVLGAQYVSSVEEALKLSQGPAGPKWRAATAEEASARGAAAGQINSETGEFKAINPPSTMAIRTNADGTTEFVQGPGAGAKFTEGQSKDNVYATRARGALEILDPIAGELASVTQRAVNVDPTGVVRGAVQSDNFQRAQQAGDEFLQAILRKDTGAAITADEQELYGKTYLPQPGDNAAVLAAKAAARQRAIAAIEAGMNADQITATERALINSAAASGAAAGAAADPAAPRRLRYNPETGALE